MDLFANFKSLNQEVSINLTESVKINSKVLNTSVINNSVSVLKNVSTINNSFI